MRSSEYFSFKNYTVCLWRVTFEICHISQVPTSDSVECSKMLKICVDLVNFKIIIVWRLVFVWIQIIFTDTLRCI